MYVCCIIQETSDDDDEMCIISVSWTLQILVGCKDVSIRTGTVHVHPYTSNALLFCDSLVRPCVMMCSLFAVLMV